MKKVLVETNFFVLPYNGLKFQTAELLNNFFFRNAL